MLRAKSHHKKNWEQTLPPKDITQVMGNKWLSTTYYKHHNYKEYDQETINTQKEVLKRAHTKNNKTVWDDCIRNEDTNI